MPPTNRRTHPEGHEEDVLLRLGIRLGRLGLQDLARPAVRSEQGHEGVDVGDVDGDRDDKRCPEPGERGAAAASPAVELVDVDKVKLRGGGLSAHSPFHVPIQTGSPCDPARLRVSISPTKNSTSRRQRPKLAGGRPGGFDTRLWPPNEPLSRLPPARASCRVERSASSAEVERPLSSDSRLWRIATSASR